MLADADAELLGKYIPGLGWQTGTISDMGGLLNKTNLLVDRVRELGWLCPLPNLARCAPEEASNPRQRQSFEIMRDTHCFLKEIQSKLIICARSKSTRKPRRLANRKQSY